MHCRKNNFCTSIESTSFKVQFFYILWRKAVLTPSYFLEKNIGMTSSTLEEAEKRMKAEQREFSRLFAQSAGLLSLRLSSGRKLRECRDEILLLKEKRSKNEDWSPEQEAHLEALLSIPEVQSFLWISERYGEAWERYRIAMIDVIRMKEECAMAASSAPEHVDDAVSMGGETAPGPSTANSITDVLLPQVPNSSHSQDVQSSPWGSFARWRGKKSAVS